LNLKKYIAFNSDSPIYGPASPQFMGLLWVLPASFVRCGSLGTFLVKEVASIFGLSYFFRSARKGGGFAVSCAVKFKAFICVFFFWREAFIPRKVGNHIYHLLQWRKIAFSIMFYLVVDHLVLFALF